MVEIRRKAEAMTAAAREEARKRRKDRSPVRHLSAVWKEAMIDRFGVGVFVSPWGGKEAALVTKMVKELGSVDACERMIRDFVSSWSGVSSAPSVGLMWTMREKLENRARGVLTGARAKIAQGEHDVEEAGDDADEGWGAAFDGGVGDDDGGD